MLDWLFGEDEPDDAESALVPMDVVNGVSMETRVGLSREIKQLLEENTADEIRESIDSIDLTDLEKKYVRWKLNNMERSKWACESLERAVKEREE